MTAAGFLAGDRELLERYLPGLDDKLSAVPLAELERPGSPAVDLFRHVRGPALFVPAEYTGLGVGLAQGVRIQRAIASRAPSLAVATTMHHFSVASLIGWEQQGAGLEWLLAEAVARNGMLVASGAAEGRPGSGILRPSMTAQRVDGGVLVDGAKKPCSLSRSMDLLFATLRVSTVDGDDRCAVAVVPADSPGLSRAPFWSSAVLAGAESDEVRLERVFVPDRLVSDLGPVGATTDPLRRSLLWFELLIAASYVGIASALAERVVLAGRAGTHVLARLAVLLDGAMFALEGVAGRVADCADPAALFGPALVARFAAQEAVASASAQAVEALGGGAFIRDPDVAYLYAAARCLAFHPPAPEQAMEALAGHLRGAPVEVV